MQCYHSPMPVSSVEFNSAGVIVLICVSATCRLSEQVKPETAGSDTRRLVSEEVQASDGEEGPVVALCVDLLVLASAPFFDVVCTLIAFLLFRSASARLRGL
jgi:hypothetical protein